MNLFPDNLGKIPLGLIVVILQTFLYVNAGAIFPEPYVQQARDIILLYMIMTFAFTIATNYVPVDVKRPFWEELSVFLVSFFLFGAVLKAVPLSQGEHIFQVEQTLRVALPFMILFAFVVAYTEELIFRGVLPKFLGTVLSNALFALFHWYAYAGNIYSILIAFVFGMVFSFVAQRFGLMGAVGMHTAWNLKILGAF